MPRNVWSLALIALLALPLVSCFDDASECPTCPAVDGGSIEVVVTPNGQVDSVQVRVDGGPQVTVKRNQVYTFRNLTSGSHALDTVRWFNLEDIVSSRVTNFQVELDRGERRTVQFHNDFPLVTWIPPGHAGRARGLDSSA